MSWLKTIRGFLCKLVLKTHTADMNSKVINEWSIEKNNNIRAVHSQESSTFASLMFDQGLPKKLPATAPSCGSERHDGIFHLSNCCSLKPKF